jgi:hypothetical protein
MLLAISAALCQSVTVFGADEQAAGTLRYVDTEFGRSLDAGSSGISVNSRGDLCAFPVTLQVRYRIEPRSFRFRNVIVAAASGQQSVWQVYHDARGTLTVEGLWQGDAQLKTDASTADGEWHDLAVFLTDSQVRVNLDGKELARRDVEWKPLPKQQRQLWIGQSPNGFKGLDGWIDDILISPGERELRNVWKPDGKELLWLDFEESESEYLAKWTPLRSTRPDAEPWEKETDDDWTDDRFQSMSRGSFFACSTKLPGRYTGTKNLVVALGGAELTPEEGRTAGTAFLFDTQRCVATAAVAASDLTIFPQRFGILQMPELRGRELFYVDARQAWRLPATGSGATESLPADALRYSGYFKHENGPVLQYTVLGADFREGYRHGPPPAEKAWSQLDSLERWFEVGRQTPLKRPVLMTLAEVDPVAQGVVSKKLVHLKHGERVVEFRLDSDSAASLQRDGNRVLLRFPAGRSANSLVCLLATQDEKTAADTTFLTAYRGGSPHFPGRNPIKASDLRGAFEIRTTDPKRRWPESFRQKVTTTQVKGLPYAVDSFEPRFSNSHAALFFITGLDFFESGTRAAVCTAHGDVWIVDSLNREHVYWSRFAAGLYQPLGLRIVDEQVIVLGRDQLTRLHDTNQDGEADYYENLNNDLVITGTPHAYATCLETDPDGNFYFFKCGRSLPHGGKLLKVSPDGKKLEVFASGYRHPIGLGVSPTGLITAADNQGNWIPASAIQVVEPGSFHGYMPEVHQPDKRDSFDQPLCWMPVSFDNSSGGQTWVADDRWGPFQGQMLHLSWGRCTLNLVVTEQVDGVWQGGAVAFPGLQFDSGPIVGRFNPKDGQLYVCGLDGWQTAARKDGSFERVRYTGGQAFMPKSLNAHKNGLWIEFTAPVDSGIASDPTSYEISQWQYRWSSEYGSPEYSIREPNRIGHDSVHIEKVSVSDDGRSVFLHIPEIKPVMQMEIRMDLAPAGGKKTARTIYNTIHRLRPAR